MNINTDLSDGLHPNALGYQHMALAWDTALHANVQPPPFDTWANGTFANGTLTDKDPAHDPDGDGLTNFQEFAFGLDPTTGASSNPISQPLNKTTGTFKYTRWVASGLAYSYESSTTLSDPWVPLLIEGVPTSNGSTPVGEITVKVAPALLNGNPKLFLRVKAE